MIGHSFIVVSVSHSIVLCYRMLNDNIPHEKWVMEMEESTTFLRTFLTCLSTLHDAWPWPPAQLEPKFFCQLRARGGSPL